MATYQHTYVHIFVPKAYVSVINDALMRVQNIAEFLKLAESGQECCCLIAKVKEFDGARHLEDAIVKNVSKISGEKTLGNIAIRVKAIN